MKAFLFLLLPGIIIFASVPVLSQTTSEPDTQKVSVDIGAGLVSRYVWRGVDYGASPNIQPAISLSAYHFTLGTWGAYNVTGGYAETDLFISYEAGPVTVLLTDYFTALEIFPNFSAPGNHYFNYRNSDTKHLYEASIILKGPEKYPFDLLGGTIVYGADKKSDNPDECNYSTYIEAGYTVIMKNNEVRFFAGYATHQGIYSNKAGIVNTGVQINEKVKITDNYSLPVYASVIVNPLMENVFLVFGMSF